MPFSMRHAAACMHMQNAACCSMHAHADRGEQCHGGAWSCMNIAPLACHTLLGCMLHVRSSEAGLDMHLLHAPIVLLTMNANPCNKREVMIV